MAAILGLDEEGVRQGCAEALGEVQAVNFNAPGQVVIAGEKQAVDRATIQLCKSRGATRANAAAVRRAFSFGADEVRRRAAERTISRGSRLPRRGSP